MNIFENGIRVKFDFSYRWEADQEPGDFLSLISSDCLTGKQIKTSGLYETFQN